MGQVLMLGDSHGNVSFMKRAFKQVVARDGADVEAVISVGDFGIWPGRSGQAFLDDAEMRAAKAEVPIIVVPGNHDDYDQLDALTPDADGWLPLREHITAAPRGHSFEIGGRTFLACGGAASPDGPGGIFPQVRGPGPALVRRYDRRTGRMVQGEEVRDRGGWWPQEIVTAADVRRCLATIDRLARDGRQVDIMVTHDVPSEVVMEGPPFARGVEVRDRLQQVLDAARPQLLFAGHWHRYQVHRLRHDPHTYAVVLSADVNPAAPQWALVDLDTLEVTPARRGHDRDIL